MPLNQPITQHITKLKSHKRVLDLNKRISSNIHKLKTNKRLLVIETNTVSSKAIIVSQHNKQLVVEGHATTKLFQERQALGDLIDQLTRADIVMPTNAIIVTPRAIPAVLKLPLPEDKPLKDHQMQELVRWETDEIAQELSLHSSIRALLIARGYLSEAQFKFILDQLDGKEKAHHATFPSRFGELAVAEGLISREQLEECLAIQEHMQQLDDDTLCGWSRYQTTTEQHLGLTTCAVMHKALHSLWVKAFRHYDIRLDAIYPAAIAPVAVLQEKTSPICVVNIEQAYLAITKIEQGEIIECIYERNFNHYITEDVVLNICRSVVNTQVSEICLHGQHPRIATFQQVLATHFKVTIEQLVAPYAKNHPEYSAMLGAASHQLKIAPCLACAAISGEPPLPPLYKRVKTWGIAMTVLIVMSMVMHEANYFLTMASTQRKIDQVNENINQVIYANELLQEKNTTFRDASRERDALKAHYETLQAKQDYIAHTLTQRTAFIRQLPLAIAAAVTDGVMLESITENSWYEFEIRGWALRQQDIDTFQRKFSKFIGKNNLMITENPSQLKSGWNKTQGYTFSLVLREKTL